MVTNFRPEIDEIGDTPSHVGTKIHRFWYQRGTKIGGLNDLERRNGRCLRYFSEFGSFRRALRKSS